MTTKVFPTPAALREMREAAAAQEIDAAVECGMGCRYAKATTRRIVFRAHHGANPDEWPHAVRVQEFPR